VTEIVPNALRILSAVAIGLYAGSMLTLAFQPGSGRVPSFLGPLGWLTALLSLAAAVAAQATVHPGRWSALGAAVLMVLDAVTFLGPFERARRAAWHRGRTVVALAALLAALLSLARVG
jgi:hypothetical protein